MRNAIAIAVLGGLLAGEVRAENLPPPPPPPSTKVEKPGRKLKGRFLSYVSFAFNAYTYLGATAKAPSANLTPASRAIIYQQLGFGYFFHPMFRVMLTVLFGETLTNVPAGASTFATLGFIPWVVFSTHGFFTGAGPLLAPISYGKTPNFDAGIYTATGYSLTLGRGFSLAGAAQLVFMFNQRTSIAVTPSLALAYRF